MITAHNTCRKATVGNIAALGISELTANMASVCYRTDPAFEGKRAKREQAKWLASEAEDGTLMHTLATWAAAYSDDLTVSKLDRLISQRYLHVFRALSLEPTTAYDGECTLLAAVDYQAKEIDPSELSEDRTQHLTREAFARGIAAMADDYNADGLHDRPDWDDLADMIAILGTYPAEYRRYLD